MGTDKMAPLNASSILAADHTSGYALSLFRPAEVKAIEAFEQKGKPYLTCAATGKARSAKPEEIVRQLFSRRLMGEYGHPVERIAVEKGVYFGSTMAEKRAGLERWRGPCSIPLCLQPVAHTTSARLA